MDTTQILAVLRDSTWQFAGVAIAIIALVMAAISLAHQLRRKSLFVTVRGYQRLVDPELAGSEDELSVTFNGQRITKLSSLSLHFSNNGSLPISSEDFETSIEVAFKNNPKILRAKISETTPKNLPVRTDISSGALIINPLLLNPKDQFEIEVLLEGMQDRTPRDIEPSVSARICGLRGVDFLSSYVPVAGIRTPLVSIEVYPATFAVSAMAAAIYYLFRVFS